MFLGGSVLAGGTVGVGWAAERWPQKTAGPVLWLNDVRGGLVESGVTPEGPSAFLRVTGESTQRVTLAGNAFWTPDSIDLAPEVTPAAVMHATGSFKLTQR